MGLLLGIVGVCVLTRLLAAIQNAEQERVNVQAHATFNKQIAKNRLRQQQEINR